MSVLLTGTVIRRGACRSPWSRVPGNPRFMAFLMINDVPFSQIWFGYPDVWCNYIIRSCGSSIIGHTATPQITYYNYDNTKTASIQSAKGEIITKYFKRFNGDLCSMGQFNISVRMAEWVRLETSEPQTVSIRRICEQTGAEG